MPKAVVIVVAVAALVTAGVVEGVRTNRWGDSEDIRAAAARLDGVPREVGPWASSENPIEEKVLRVAEAAGNVSREYRNTKTGAVVDVLLLCGPSGPIGAHTPDICYAGIGYEIIGNPAKQTVALPGGGSAAYWTARFGKKSAPNDAPLQVCWAWGVDGDWAASDAPRREFALRSALYKLYVTRRVSPSGPDPIPEFLGAFLPEVKKALAPAPAAAQ